MNVDHDGQKSLVGFAGSFGEHAQVEAILLSRRPAQDYVIILG